MCDWLSFGDERELPKGAISIACSDRLAGTSTPPQQPWRPLPWGNSAWRMRRSRQRSVSVGRRRRTYLATRAFSLCKAWSRVQTNMASEFGCSLRANSASARGLPASRSISTRAGRSPPRTRACDYRGWHGMVRARCPTRLVRVRVRVRVGVRVGVRVRVRVRVTLILTLTLSLTLTRLVTSSTGNG